MKYLFMCLGLIGAMSMAGVATAQKPAGVEITQSGIDLFTHSFAYKVKEKQGVPSINNLTFYVANQGDTDAPNSRIEYWLSDDTVLDASDSLIHTQSLGKVKSGKIKKRTVGGGLLKKLGLTTLTNDYFIVVVDADEMLTEALEDNNTFIGTIFN